MGMYKRLTRTSAVVERPENRHYRDAFEEIVRKHRVGVEEIRGKVSSDGGWDFPSIWKTRAGLRSFDHFDLPFAQVYKCVPVSEKHLDFLRFAQEMATAWVETPPHERADAGVREAFLVMTSSASLFFGVHMLDLSAQARQLIASLMPREKIIVEAKPPPRALNPSELYEITPINFNGNDDLFPPLLFEDMSPPKYVWVRRNLERYSELEPERKILRRLLRELANRLTIGQSDVL